MRFLVDAQLPRRLARALIDAGHDAVHTLDLPDQNRTGDAEVNMRADAEDRVVVSKDSDFRDSHLMRGTPRRLLRVTTGNTDNAQLLALFAANLDTVVRAFDEADYVELSATGLIVHPRR